MPDLHRVLADHDLTLLRLIAEHWGIELAAGSQREAADELTARMLEPDLAREIAGALPAAAQAAFQELARDGRQPMPQFVRRHGELRAMGPARRERERPWANAPSVTEVLWYRGLIGRAFFESRQPGGQRGPEEFVFVPDDLRSLVYVAPAAAASAIAPPGAPSAAPANWAATLDAAADDAVTLLAYLQVTSVRPEAALFPTRHRESVAEFLRQPAALDLGLHLLRQLGLVADSPLKLDPNAVQPFLQAGSPERARRLAEAWRDSREWNDLLAVPGLVFEGAGWHNDPLGARTAILALLAQVPAGAWWSLDGFIQSVKERQPDFQRPAGDYDSWYIRDGATAGGGYLRGFANWERVDGALVRWLIESPMAWLGLVETGPLEESSDEPAEAGGPPPAAFRLTPYGAALLGQAGWPEPPEPAALELAQPLGLVRAPAGATGHDRFQLARVSDWGRPEAGPAGAVYPYRLTPGALKRAAQKGIPPGRIIGFLERAAAGQPGMPPLLAALRRWEQHGPEAALRQTVVLRLANPQLLETLRAAPGVAPLLGEPLGPTAVAVRVEDAAALEAALAELGILATTD
jgi:hypothetical protein